jgi:hypothetical protein
MSDSRVFHLGGVLVGTLAFRAYANALGVRSQRAALQTQDVDIAHDRQIGIALARETARVDLDRIIEVMLEDRPADLRDAWAALPGDTARQKVREALQALNPELRERVDDLRG